MTKSLEAMIKKPIHQERRFQFIEKKQIEYWAEIDAGAYKYLPESERRIVYSELEVKALIAALGQAQALATQQGNIGCALFDEVTQLHRRIAELEARGSGMLAALENHEQFWSLRELELGSLSPEAAMARDVGIRAICSAGGTVAGND